MGTASARLLASGTLRRDRLDALSLLGLLVDHADAQGSLRLPFDTLVGEFGLAPERGRELLDALLAVDVVQVTQGDGMAVAGPLPAHPGAFRLSAFLANVTVVLDDGRSVDPSVYGTPHPLSWPGRERPGRRRRSGTRALSRVMAGTAASVVIIWSTASPSGEPTAVRTAAGPSSSTGRAPWATTPTSAVRPDRPAESGGDPRPAASPVAPVAPVAPIPEVELSPAGSATTGLLASDDTDGTSTGPAPPTPGPSAPGSPQSPQQSPQAPPAGSGPAAPPEATPTTCPVEQIEADVVDTRLLPAVAPNLLDVVSASGVEVRGTLWNRSRSDLVVRSFDVSVSGGTPVSVAGSPVPLALPAGVAADWRVVLPPATSVPTLSLVEVRVLDWTWTDPLLSASCAD